MTKALQLHSTRYPWRKRVSIKSKEDEICLTEQHHKDACDINNILKRYDRDGVITHVNEAKAQYGDFSEVNEFQESLNLVIQSKQSFMELPSAIRKRFGNDPGLFMEFITDPKNMPEMIEMGLANAPQPEAKPIKVEIAEKPATKPAEKPAEN